MSNEKQFKLTWVEERQVEAVLREFVKSQGLTFQVPTVDFQKTIHQLEAVINKGWEQDD